MYTDLNLRLPLRIFAVDPATGKSGWALLVLESLEPLQVRVEARGQIDGQKLLKTRKDMGLLFDRQFCILDALEEEYTRLFTLLNPDVAVSESAYGYTHMNALISLTLAINVLKRVSKAILGKDCITVPPTISKKSFTGHGGADKDAMRKAYFTAVFLIRDLQNEEITEHEVDAIGHGVAYIKLYITKEIVQHSAKERKLKKKERIKSKLESGD